jgi:ABC-type sugar transport system permease subunit
MSRRGRRQLVIPFILPALALYTLVFVYPALQSFWVALHDWNGFDARMKFIGLGNFREMLNDHTLRVALWHTLFISLVGGVGIFALAILFTALLTRNLRGKKFFRALIFFPVIVPGIGLGLIWQFIYNNNWGPLSSFLHLIGLGRLDQLWLAPDNVIQSLTAAIIWSYVGYYMVILLAGVDKIPRSFFESAVLDGAGEWKVFVGIILPMIWDLVVIALVLWVIGSLKIFDLIAATVFPAPPESSYTMTIYIWVQAVGAYTPVFRLGYASALGVLLLVLVVIAVAGVRLATRREAIEY